MSLSPFEIILKIPRVFFWYLEHLRPTPFPDRELEDIFMLTQEKCIVEKTMNGNWSQSQIPHTPVSNFYNKYAFIQQLERNIKLRSLPHNWGSITWVSMWMPTMHKALEFYTSKLLYSSQPLLSIPSHFVLNFWLPVYVYLFYTSVYPFSQELFWLHVCILYRCCWMAAQVAVNG